MGTSPVGRTDGLVGSRAVPKYIGLRNPLP
jgi:hypothetical protein